MKRKTPSRKIFEALVFATQAHSEVRQCRKGTTVPYIVHPLGVATILLEHGCSDAVVISGLLHDTVEDTNVTLEQVKQKFGPKVARLVCGLSEPDKSDSWENRKRHTIEYLAHAPSDLVLISLADKLDNIRAIRQDQARLGEEVWKRFNRPRRDQKWYFESLASVFHKRLRGTPVAPLAREFHQEVRNTFL